MAITNGQITVATLAVQIDGRSVNPSIITIHNMSATNNLYIGNADVDANNGYNLHANTNLTINLSAGDTVYCLSSLGTHDISWIKTSN